MSQNAQILTHLKRHGTITPLEALNKYGILRLAARCYDLREKGYGIETRTIERNGKRFALYAYHARGEHGKT